jgi:tape measure domain-containing protein
VSVVANVAINVDSRGAVGQLKAVQQGAVATDKAFSGLLKTVGKLAIALSAMQAVKFVFAKTAELESQTRSLEVLTGSAAKAKQIIQELQQLGAVTPFTSTELIDAAKRLQAFGVETEKVVQTTRRLADVSGATGAELQGLVTAYGQVQAKGRLQGEELLQFQERGVALQGELQKMYGLSGEELRKALEKGRISAEAVEVAIIRLTDVGGKYANGAIAQSDTLNGKFSTLMDSVEMLAKNIGNVLAPQIKNIINLAIEGINQINNLFAQGLQGDYMRRTAAAMAQIKAGFRSEALDTTGKLLSEISRSPQRATKGGIQAQLEALAGVEKVLNELNNASALPDAVTERVMRQSDAINKLRGDLKGYLNDLKAVTKPTAATPKTPPLLAEKAKDKGGMSMGDILSPAIMQQLELRKAHLETFKQSQLIQAQQAKMNNEDLARAKRMIDFAHQYRIEKLNTMALEKNLQMLDKERSAYIASHKPDSRAAATKFIDTKRAEIAHQILLIQEKTNTIAREHYREALEAQTQQEELLKKETESQTLLGQQRKQSLTDELSLMQARLAGNEAEVMLRIQIRNIMAGTSGLSQQDVTNTLNQINATKQLLTEKEKIANLVQNIGSSIESGIVGAIDGAITGAKSLQESLADVLKDIGRMLISFGIKSLLGGIDIGGTKIFGGGKAAGGPVSSNSTYMVGEKGPELFVPSSSGTIIPADATAAAMARYQRQGSGSGAGGSSSDAMGAGAATPVLSMSFETTRFLGQDYVSTDQLQAAMMATEKRAAAAGAKAGAAQVTSKLQQSPAYRRQVGLR